MNRILFLLLIVFASIKAGAQTAPADTGLVKWLSFKQAFEQNKKQQKPFLIDVYTDWCGWCKHMIKTTYSQPDLANYINNYFYPVKFNAESKDTIEYLGEKYANPGPKNSTHQLARKLLGNNISYPSTIFSNNNFQFNLVSAGYLDIKKIEPLLIYTVENVFRTTPYEEFEAKYEKAFYANNPKKEEVKWMTFKEAQKQKKPKKTIVFIHTNWCNSCRVMYNTTFSDSLVKPYLEKNFYLVDFNPATKDTIEFNGQKYYPQDDTPFHPFVNALLRGNFALPSTVIIDENNQIIDGLPLYLSPQTFDPILHFYGENAYKKESWQDFQKKYKSQPEGKKEKAQK